MVVMTLLLIENILSTESGDNEQQHPVGEDNDIESNPWTRDTQLSPPQPPVPQRTARATRCRAHADRGRAHLRYMQPPLPCTEDVAVLVQWL